MGRLPTNESKPLITGSRVDGQTIYGVDFVYNEK